MNAMIENKTFRNWSIQKAKKDMFLLFWPNMTRRLVLPATWNPTLNCIHARPAEWGWRARHVDHLFHQHWLGSPECKFLATVCIENMDVRILSGSSWCRVKSSCACAPMHKWIASGRHHHGRMSRARKRTWRHGGHWGFSFVLQHFGDVLQNSLEGAASPLNSKSSKSVSFTVRGYRKWWVGKLQIAH